MAIEPNINEVGGGQPASEPAGHTAGQATGQPTGQPTNSPKQKRRFLTVPNIIGIVLCVLMLPGFVISTTLLISSLIHPDLPPSCFGFTPLIVETGSMSPMFDENDVVLINNSDEDDTYSVNEIICFHSGDVYVTHRIHAIETREDGSTVYITKGDANNTGDAPFAASRIRGEVKAVLPGVGGAILWLKTPPGLCLILLVGVLLLLVSYLIRKGRKAHDGTKR